MNIIDGPFELVADNIRLNWLLLQHPIMGDEKFYTISVEELRKEYCELRSYKRQLRNKQNVRNQ